ncbi:22144_t:CDS:2, partial [Gigaspora rosea]
FITKKSIDPEDISEDKYISNVILKKRMPKKKVESLPDFHKELTSVYRVMVEDEIGPYYRLHVGDIVTMISEEEGEILRSIFSHKRDNLCFAFIIVDRFELTNQMKLECPVYRLQNTRKIYPISKVDTNNIAHFIHYCNNNECTNAQDQTNKSQSSHHSLKTFDDVIAMCCLVFNICK